jgi:hypothetical protein
MVPPMAWPLVLTVGAVLTGAGAAGAGSACFGAGLASCWRTGAGAGAGTLLDGTPLTAMMTSQVVELAILAQSWRSKYFF